MDAYTGFAYVYDEYMDNIPYEEWGQYMIALLKENGVSGDFMRYKFFCTFVSNLLQQQFHISFFAHT